MDPEAAAIATVALTKTYRGSRSPALRDVTLAVPAGSVTGLVGPNGAGKSTLFKTVLGFERPTTGSVRVAGVDPSVDPGRALAQVGYVPQSPFLYRELSIADHLDLVGSLRPGFDRALAEDRLARLRLPPDVVVDHLSGGQRAQVALSLALGTRASVLLLDEPLAGLDPLARRGFLHALAETVRETRQTVVMSSHVVGDVEQACDRLMVIGEGRLRVEGSIADLLGGHRVVVNAGDAAAGDAVGAFPDADGRLVWLLRSTDLADDPSPRPASLEDVVLGYLAASSGPGA